MIGKLRYELPDGPLELAVSSIQLRGGRLVVAAQAFVYPGNPDVALPAGRWPVELVGEDGRTVYQSEAEFLTTNTVHCAPDDFMPATLTVVQPFGDPDQQTET